MLSLISYQSNKINVFFGDIQKINQRSDYSFLNDQENSRADSFLKSEDKELFVCCRANLKKILSDLLSIPLERIRVKEGVNGKPYLEGSNIFFNVSHTEGKFAIAITNLGSVGIDIELKNRSFDYQKLSHLIFSHNEKVLFETIESTRKNEAFLNCWTRKEAIFKAIGSGLSSPLHQLELTFIPDSEPELLKTGWDEKDKDNWMLRSIDYIENLICTVAARTGNKHTELVCFELDELTYTFKTLNKQNEIHHNCI